ncbi:TonB-dependent receptor [Sulfidibacter corallicola]|uniref:TonB-dependent receptor n=1 Tax=Sulfidibacter corallicola TaxID=2818388 RepID=A0A8A4TD19_SULCO|nr:TonB-dependent receptor [Sulfidibacter corallicola]QTD47989.1 TonB-dependent receptor [Sulfidibacter corallicola]
MKKQAIALAVFLTSLAFAQSNETGAITGVVIDSNGFPISGVTVKCTLPDGSYPKASFTNEMGTYRIVYLNPGVYTLTVSAADKPTKKVTGIRVSATQTEVVDVLLETTANVTETLTVTATESLIQRATTETNFDIDVEELNRLPITRTAIDLLDFVPGASTDGIFGGSGDAANNYALDGVSVTSTGFGGSFLLPNVNWIQEFQVKGLGVGAEYGNFQGGLVNIVTKSGSNTFSGNVHAIFESESWNSSTLEPGFTGTEVDTFGEFNADVAGAFIKDRLYYFFSVEQQQRDLNVVDAFAPNAATEVSFFDTQIETTETKLYGKITLQATPDDTVNFVVGLDDLETDNRGFNNTINPNASFNQESPALLYNLSWNHAFNSGNFLELKLTGYNAEDNRLSKNGFVAGVREFTRFARRDRNALFDTTRDLDNNAARVVFNTFQNWGGSEHHIKIGGEYTLGAFVDQSIRNGNYSWVISLADANGNLVNPADWDLNNTFTEWGGNSRLDAETTNTAIFIQDDFKVGKRLDVSVGVRYAKWEGELTPGFTNAATLMAADDSAVAPRVGFTFDLSGNNTLVARAHWGRFYQGMFADQYDRVADGAIFADQATQFWQWTGSTPPDLNQNINAANRDQFFDFLGNSSPLGSDIPLVDYNQPYMDQLSITIEKQFAERWKASLVYINRENKDILGLVDRNIDTNYNAVNNVSIYNRNADGSVNFDDLFVFLPTLFVASDSYNPDVVLTTIDDAFRETDQYQLILEGHGDGWSLSASIVNTEIEGNFYSVSGEEAFNGFNVDPFVNPNEQINATGRMPNYPEWEYKLRFNYDLPWNFRVSAFYRIESGDFFSDSYRIDNTGFRAFITEDGSELGSDVITPEIIGQSVFLQRRGDKELENWSRLDFRLEYLLHISAGRLVLSLDAFNLLNEDAITSRNADIDSISFSRQPPRTIQFKAAYRW